MSSLTVVIPNYDGEGFLKDCFESIINQNLSLDVIIIDNGSEDGSVKFIKENYPEFTLIENSTNLGFSKAVNQGIKASKSDYIFLMNNDAELGINCILNLIKCIEKDDNIFAAAAKMIQYQDKSKLDDAGDEYTILGWTKKTGDGKPSNLYDQGREIFSACAGAALYRREIFDRIGYFDENFFAYMEDVDISYRARIHGFNCRYCPESIVYHRTSSTSGSRYNEFKIKLAARNNVYVPYKNMPWPQLLVNGIFLLIGFFIKYLFFSKKKQGKIYLKGLKEGLNTLNKIKKVPYENKNVLHYFKIEYLLIKNTLKFITL